MSDFKISPQVSVKELGEARLIGIEPIQDVTMMENHNQAYVVWQSAGVRDKILVHIDAHLDFGWITDRDPYDLLEANSLTQLKEMIKEGFWNLGQQDMSELVSIGNYIYPAMKEGMVREVYWVVPNPMWDNKKERSLIIGFLNRLLKINPDQGKRVIVKEKAITLKINGRIVSCSKLSDMPLIKESVLLDIDTDFLVSKSLSKPQYYANEQRPWIWPQELIEQVKNKIKADLVTIAYSVDGGYTPLRYKYLGDELKDLIKDPNHSLGNYRLIAHKRRADGLRLSGQVNEAIAEFAEAVRLRPDDASAHYSLAHLYCEKGLWEEAISSYQKAINIDPSFRTMYNNYGMKYGSLGLLDKAENEYKKMLRLDPTNAAVYSHLANLLTKRGRWREAEAMYKKSIGLEGNNFPAHYGLGYIYKKAKNWDKAEIEYKRCLELKPNSPGAHYWLGLLSAKRGAVEEAIKEYKNSLKLGLGGFWIHLRLGNLYRQQGNVYRARWEYRRAMELLPALVFFYLKTNLKRIWRFIFANPK